MIYFQKDIHITGDLLNRQWMNENQDWDLSRHGKEKATNESVIFKHIKTLLLYANGLDRSIMHGIPLVLIK